MNRVLRACVLWLMVIAMPAQAMAAATMVFCGPSHERLRPALAAQGTAVSWSVPEATADDPAAGHHAAGHAHGASLVPAADATDKPGPASHHDGASCSVCAACCLAWAPPASVAWVDASERVRLAPAPAVMTLQSHQPDGLERPPRRASAR